MVTLTKTQRLFPPYFPPGLFPSPENEVSEPRFAYLPDLRPDPEPAKAATTANGTDPLRTEACAERHARTADHAHGATPQTRTELVREVTTLWHASRHDRPTWQEAFALAVVLAAGGLFYLVGTLFL